MTAELIEIYRGRNIDPFNVLTWEYYRDNQRLNFRIGLVNGEKHSIHDPYADPLFKELCRLEDSGEVWRGR